mgnify:CR=1 FL=1
MRHQSQFESMGSDLFRPGFHFSEKRLSDTLTRVGFQDSDHDDDRSSVSIRHAPYGAEKADQSLLFGRKEDHGV